MLITIAQIALKSLVALIFLFLLTRLIGFKQISQMDLFDYTIGISIGSIAAEVATNLDTEYYEGLTAMTVFAVVSVLLAILENKSIRVRRFVEGKPVLLVNNGKIEEKNFKKVRVDINQFLSNCRGEGYFNIADIKFAIFETTGKISILPKEDKRPANCGDFKLKPQPEGLCANLIIDGHVMEDSLKSAGRDKRWLDGELSAQGVGNIGEVFLAAMDVNGTLTVFKKNNSGKEIKELE